MQEKISFGKQFGLAVKSYGKAITFVLEKGLWKYCIWSVVVAVVLMLWESYISSSVAGYVETRLMELLQFNFLGESLKAVLGFFIRTGIRIIFYFIYLSINKYILLTLLSPLMAILSEKTENLYYPSKQGFQLGQFVKDVLRGIVLAFRNMSIELLIVLLSFIIVWIPIIGWLSPFVLFILSCYFYGFSMIDYINERRKLNIHQSIAYVNQHKGLAIGNGLIFALLFAIPYIGVIIGASLAPVAAAVAVLDMEKAGCK